MKTTKYYLKHETFGEKEVTKDEWIKAERAAGFRPKIPYSHPDYMKVCATGGFSSGSISGSIRYV